MQGRIRNQPIVADVRTQCAHCDEPIRIEVDDELRYRVRSEGAEPLISAPLINLRKLKDSNIIDAF